MTLTSRIVFLILPLAMTGWLRGEVRMRAGLWENTITASGQTATRNACITPEQERQSNVSVEAMRESAEKALSKSAGCSLKEFTLAGGVQTVVMVCGKTTIRNVTKFNGDSFETNGTATTPEGVKVSVIKGRRIGDCPPGGVK